MIAHITTASRSIVVLFLFDSFCELQKGNNVVVCPEIIEMPIMCGRRLWEAPNQKAWESEYDRLLKTQRDVREPLKLKDLWNEANGEKLEGWVAEMDVLGSAVLGIAISANEADRS